jgi:hypothetical protein
VAGLTSDMLEFIASGIAHQVGGRTADGRPCICRALAARQEADDRLAVLISAESGYEVLDAIRANGCVSLTVVAPMSHRALNLKGRDAVVEHAAESDLAFVEQRRLPFQRQLEGHGFPPDFTRAWYDVDSARLMVIRFTPADARDQTPGPGAGALVELHQ